MPGAAHVVAALEHQEVVVALLEQSDGHAQARKAAADDAHVHLGREPRPTRSRRLLHRYYHSPSSFTYTTHLRDPGRYSVDRLMDQTRWSVDQLGA